MICCAVRVERLRKGEERNSKVMLEFHNVISFPEGLDADICKGIVRRNIDGIVGLAMGMAGVNSQIIPSYDKLATMSTGELLVFVTAGKFLVECYKVNVRLQTA